MPDFPFGGRYGVAATPLSRLSSLAVHVPESFLGVAPSAPADMIHLGLSREAVSTENVKQGPCRP